MLQDLVNTKVFAVLDLSKPHINHDKGEQQKKQKDVLRIRFHVEKKAEHERLYHTRNHNTSKTEICSVLSASPNASKQRLDVTFRPPNIFPWIAFLPTNHRPLNFQIPFFGIYQVFLGKEATV